MREEPSKAPDWATLLRTIAVLAIGAFVLQVIQGLWLTALITAAVFAGLVLLWRTQH
jgi:hypothetical protein